MSGVGGGGGLMVSKDMRGSLPAGGAGGERNVERRFRRRGFLFGLFAAPLVPATVKAAPETGGTEFFQLLRTYSPEPWCKAWLEVAAEHPAPISRIVGGERVYDEEYLRRVFKDVTPHIIVDDGDHARMVEVPSSYTDWKYLIEALADRPLRFSGEAPVGTPFPLPVDETGWRPWVDRRSVEIVRVREQASTTPSESCESSRTGPSDADCAA